MKSERPLILISNDDSITAKGIYALIDFASEFGDIFVVAPSLPQSGKSSAITVETPLRATRLPDYKGATMYHVNGTPVDCTKLALNSLMPRNPDYIISGINHGANTGNSAIYSGTMGVVFEGNVRGIPSIGFSYLDHKSDTDFSPCKPIVTKILRDVIAKGLPQGVSLNVNMPKDCIIKGTKVAHAAKGVWSEEFQKRIDPHGHEYYWLTGKYINYEPESTETDLYWLSQQYASVVPCQADQTAFSAIKDIDKLLK
ncbi:MAG: 5'/3'-nucleotidase SurE [Muribaculaceae bacterium]